MSLKSFNIYWVHQARSVIVTNYSLTRILEAEYQYFTSTCMWQLLFLNNRKKEIRRLISGIKLNEHVVACISMCFTFTPGEPRREKTFLLGFRPGPTHTRLYSHRMWLDTRNFGFRLKRNCTIQEAKTKALVCVTVFA